MSGNPFNPPTPPATLPGNLSPVTPVLARRGVYEPEVGKRLTLSLEGEIVASEITEVIDRDTVVAKITSIVTGKAPHPYRSGSIVAVQRKWNGLSEIWEPISDREVREQEAVERVRQQVAAEQTRKAAEQRGIDLEAEPPEAEVEASAVAGEIGSPAATAPPVPHGTEGRKVLGPRRSKVARVG